MNLILRVFEDTQHTIWNRRRLYIPSISSYQHMDFLIPPLKDPKIIDKFHKVSFNFQALTTRINFCYSQAEMVQISLQQRQLIDQPQTAQDYAISSTIREGLISCLGKLRIKNGFQALQPVAQLGVVQSNCTRCERQICDCLKGCLFLNERRFELQSYLLQDSIKEDLQVNYKDQIRQSFKQLDQKDKPPTCLLLQLSQACLSLEYSGSRTITNEDRFAGFKNETLMSDQSLLLTRSLSNLQYIILAKRNHRYNESPIKLISQTLVFTNNDANLFIITQHQIQEQKYSNQIKLPLEKTNVVENTGGPPNHLWKARWDRGVPNQSAVRSRSLWKGAGLGGALSMESNFKRALMEFKKSFKFYLIHNIFLDKVQDLLVRISQLVENSDQIGCDRAHHQHQSVVSSQSVLVCEPLLLLQMVENQQLTAYTQEVHYGKAHFENSYLVAAYLSILQSQPQLYCLLKPQQQFSSEGFQGFKVSLLAYRNKNDCLTARQRQTHYFKMKNLPASPVAIFRQIIAQLKYDRKQHTNEAIPSKEKLHCRAQARFCYNQEEKHQQQGMYQKWNQTVESQEHNRESFIKCSTHPHANKNTISVKAKSQIQQPSYGSLMVQELIYKPTLQDCKRCTGLIRCIWNDIHGRTQAVGYATAFAISPRIIVTCCHSIFWSKRARICNKIYFVPWHGDTSATQPEHLHQSEDKNFVRFQALEPGQIFSRKPIRKDYAVFIIKKPFENKCYLQFSTQLLHKRQPLELSGFPSLSYDINTPLLNNTFKRVDHSGRFEKVKHGYILVHNMPTQGGHSGSPILRLTDQNGEQSIKVAGIHTHKGRGKNNEGLVITEQLIYKIRKFSKQLCQVHNLDFDQQFPKDRLVYQDDTSREYFQKLYSCR